MPQTIFLILLIMSIQNFLICNSNKEKSDSNENDVFVPTNEWQVVKEGQSIPKGLHVRINLQTGLKEAKLLDPTEKQSTKSYNTEQSKALLQVEQTSKQEEENNVESDSNLYSPEELKRVLENIKNDESLPQFDKDDIKRVKEQFKDYEHLKKELEDINISVKSDAEILRDLFKKFEKVMSDKTLDSLERESEILDILVYFEYLVHQIDNANDFIGLNGLPDIIYKNLNNTDYKIRSESLNILGSCVQNNAKAQISALESGAIVTVLRLLATEQINTVKIRAVYSLSSLLRRFPLAQKHFIKNGGLNILAKIFSKPENMKIQLKIVTLIYDLLVEQKESLEDKKIIKEKAKQYKEVDLKNTLIKNDWCIIFDTFLINIANIKQTDHDAIERCLNVMLLVSDRCLSTFHNKNLLNVLTDFYNNYSNLSADENTVDPDSFPYFTNLKNVSHQLLSVVSSVKTEL